MMLLRPECLWFLWLLPLLTGFFLYVNWRRRLAQSALGDAALIARLTAGASAPRRRARFLFLLLAILAALLAAARPAWSKREEIVHRQGRDIVFLIDVSRSMLATDLLPNRLERAKLAIRDCLESLEGDRVSLIAFSGHAVVTCPLTTDYGFFRMMLEELSPRSVSRGGTMIGDAIRKGLSDGFDNEEKKHKDIILITDGEDQESFPVEAAAEAGKRGIRLLIIGIGNESEGQPIPVTDELGRSSFLQYRGEDVKSRLNAGQLREMVEATPGGRYLNVATGTIDLGAVYRDLIATAEKRQLEDRQITQADEKFQLFLAIALFFLLAEMIAGEAKKKDGDEAPSEESLDRFTSESRP